MKKGLFEVVGAGLIALLFLLVFIKFTGVSYLVFSDAAKFADIARNIISGFGYKGTFSFWSSGILELSQKAAFPSPWLPPAMPLSITLFFRFFGISDFAVIATSSFYFILLTVFTFKLGEKLFGKLTGYLSALAMASSINFLNYASQGATEPLFTFEIVAGAYFVSLKKKWATILALIFMVFMYFTRPQAFIYIAGLIFYWLLLNLRFKRAVILFIGVIILGFLIDFFIMPHFGGRYFLYSVTGRGLGTVTNVASGGSASEALRGAAEVSGVGIVSTFKKVFYNLYNFYKLLPQIFNPYLFTLFALSLFVWGGDRISKSFRISSLFMLVLTFLVAAVSIPFFRYLHPVIPIIYILSIGFLVDIVSDLIKNKKKSLLVSAILVFMFAVGQSLGVIFLDSRFVANSHNIGKPPVYVELSKILRENTSRGDFVVTNLDTWGSWYGDRRTVWFPVEPNQIVDKASGLVPFDSIFLTSYLIDDQNYYMGASWREILNNPNDSTKWTCEGCSEIAQKFRFKGMYRIGASDDYERKDFFAVLLVKKE